MSELAEQLKDSELLSRLADLKDLFVERASATASEEWLKTVVAFANSAPLGYPAVLYIGVGPNGKPEPKANLKAAQLTLSEKIAQAYPPIYHLPRILEVEGKKVLAAVVPGSSQRPHFAGPAYVRQGSTTVAASEAQLNDLIALRESKVYELLKWRGKTVVVEWLGDSVPGSRPAISKGAEIVDCNAFYVTLRSGEKLESEPLSRVDISFEHKVNLLKLEIRPR